MTNTDPHALSAEAEAAISDLRARTSTFVHPGKLDRNVVVELEDAGRIKRTGAMMGGPGIGHKLIFELVD